MAATVRVEVVSPERLVWSGDAAMVIARGAEGELGVLPEHAPLITFLVPGDVRIRRTEEPELMVAVTAGFLEVKPDRVTILAETAAIRAVGDHLTATEADA